MIDFPRRVLSDETGKGYRVYKAADDFVLVEANMASEAIEKSGIENPYKVIRSIDELSTVLMTHDLTEVKEESEENNEAESPNEETEAGGNIDSASPENTPETTKDIAKEATEEQPPEKAD